MRRYSYSPHKSEWPITSEAGVFLFVLRILGAFGPTQTTVGTHGAIDDSIDLSASTFDIPGQDSGFGDEHSGEFNASIQPLKPFYDTLMDELELERNSP